MSSVGYTQFRENLATHLKNVVSDHVPLVVTRQKEEPVVVLSKRDYDGLQETLYLLSSPVNAERLMRSIAEVEAGKTIERDIVEM